ncbi:4444_t:CDS:1 [Paraglomus occultum]|uniref:4444_t:CDS:1 n=1 Tax=Paraglomus occultum TaxID=144539 RepID=A0A9N9FJQ7_9GLOM|nr:4444_t:CDS:1 [Paraglomus occultum]
MKYIRVVYSKLIAPFLHPTKIRSKSCSDIRRLSKTPTVASSISSFNYTTISYSPFISLRIHVYSYPRTLTLSISRHCRYSDFKQLLSELVAGRKDQLLVAYRKKKGREVGVDKDFAVLKEILNNEVILITEDGVWRELMVRELRECDEAEVTVLFVNGPNV